MTTVLNLPFRTIRAAVDSVAKEIEKTTKEKFILFGQGFDVTIKEDLVAEDGVYLFAPIETLMPRVNDATK